MAEGARAIIRARVGGRLTSDQERAALRALHTFAQRCFVVGINDTIMARIGRPFPVEPIRPLDALHLATLEFLGEPSAFVTIVTRDIRVAQNGRALGYSVE
jgi:hypothetical protein